MELASDAIRPNRDQKGASFASRRQGEFLRRSTLCTDAIRSRALPLPEKASHRQLTPPAGRDKLHAGTTRARAFSVNFPYHEARDRVRPSNAGYISKTRFSQRESERGGRGRGEGEKREDRCGNSRRSQRRGKYRYLPVEYFQCRRFIIDYMAGLSILLL